MAPNRGAILRPEQAPSPTLPEASAAQGKSWKARVRKKIEGHADKPGVSLSPWSAAGALAVVVGLILLLARLFRRNAPLFPQSLPQEALEILGRHFVDPRQTIVLVRIGARILVVGSSANGLSSLGQIDDPVEVDVLAGICRRGTNAGMLGTSFFKMLKGERTSRPATRPSPASTAARETAPRSSLSDFKPDSEPCDLPPEGTSQPEYDLMRRLRKTAAPLPASSREAA